MEFDNVASGGLKSCVPSPDGDQMDTLDTVSLQAVTLVDGSTAYIQREAKPAFSDGQIMDGQVIQLEDGSAAYVRHVSMPKAGATSASSPVYTSRMFGIC